MKYLAIDFLFIVIEVDCQRTGFPVENVSSDTGVAAGVFRVGRDEVGKNSVLHSHSVVSTNTEFRSLRLDKFQRRSSRTTAAHNSV
jgi:hypothetical protein